MDERAISHLNAPPSVPVCVHHRVVEELLDDVLM